MSNIITGSMLVISIVILSLYGGLSWWTVIGVANGMFLIGIGWVEAGTLTKEDEASE